MTNTQTTTSEPNLATPFISVITAVTALQTEFLPYLVYLYCCQDYPPLRRELIILDTTPNNQQARIDSMVQSLSEDFKVRYIHSSLPCSDAEQRHVLNRQAAGEYIICMDSDVYYPATYLSDMLGVVQQHQIPFVQSEHIDTWYSHLDRIYRHQCAELSGPFHGTSAYHRSYFHTEAPAPAASFLRHRSCLAVRLAHGEKHRIPFYPPEEELTTLSLEDLVEEPMLKTWYRSLKTAAKQAIAQAAERYVIGFYMETAFHYQVYRSIISHLLDRGYRCHLVINDGVHLALLKEMQTLLGEINEPRLFACLLSNAQANRQQYSCLVSPYYSPELNDLAPLHIRTLYGLAKERWNHAWWNTFYHRILCYSHYSQQALNINGNAVIVGNPRFDEWYNLPNADGGLNEIKLDPEKPTLLYAPTFGALSSIPHWAKQLERLSRDFNVVTKLHHGTSCRPEEASSLAMARRHLKKRVKNHALTFHLLRKADFVLTDNSGFIFDAIHAGKRTILLSWENMESLLEEKQTLSSPFSAEQRIRNILPEVRDIKQLRYWLGAEEEWQKLEEPLSQIRSHYCDAWQDGKAGERAANAIINALITPEPPQENALLHSLRQVLFNQA